MLQSQQHQIYCEHQQHFTKQQNRHSSNISNEVELTQSDHKHSSIGSS